MIKEVLQKDYDYVPNYSSDNVLNERDFYPIPDERFWESYVEDIEDGDNFADYCKYFFSICDEEEYFD